MFWVCLFDFADRNVFSVTQESIKAEFSLSDFQLGVLGAAFALLFSVVGVPIGRLADRHNRIRIVAACTALWSLATMLCGFAANYAMMALGRIGVGLGEAGFMGPTSSLVADQFPPRQRASRMAIIMLGTPAGVLLGANVGGWAAQACDWRLAFLLLGAPGLLVAACVLLFLREPPRGLSEAPARAVDSGAGLGPFLRETLRNPPLLWIVAGGVTAGLGMTTISMFLASFLARSHGLSPGQAGALFGIIVAASQSIGFIGGSFVTDWLSRRDLRWPAWGAALGLFCAPGLYWAGLTAPGTAAAAGLLILAGISQSAFFGPTIGMIQNIVHPRMRATSAALFAMFNVLGGYFCAPPLIGFLSDRFAQQAFGAASGGQAVGAICPGGVPAPGAPPDLADACAAATAAGLQQAMLWGVSILFAAAFCYFMVSRTLRRERTA